MSDNMGRKIQFYGSDGKIIEFEPVFDEKSDYERWLAYEKWCYNFYNDKREDGLSLNDRLRNNY